MMPHIGGAAALGSGTMAATSAAIKVGKLEREKGKGLAPARRMEEALFVLRRRRGPDLGDEEEPPKSKG